MTNLQEVREARPAKQETMRHHTASRLTVTTSIIISCYALLVCSCKSDVCTRGGPCENDDDCCGNNICFTEAMGFPGGFCSRECTGYSDPECLDDCRASGTMGYTICLPEGCDCREGYTCHENYCRVACTDSCDFGEGSNDNLDCYCPSGICRPGLDYTCASLGAAGEPCLFPRECQGFIVDNIYHGHPYCVGLNGGTCAPMGVYGDPCCSERDCDGICTVGPTLEYCSEWTGYCETHVCGAGETGTCYGAAGDPCETDDDCSGSCFRHASWPGGYCSTSDGPSVHVGEDPDHPRYLRVCESDTECRTGYSCDWLSDHSMRICWPD
jgi:hypothetical protein